MAVLSHAGTTVSVGSAIAQVISVTPISMEREAVRTDDLAAGSMTFRPSKKLDGGELEFSVYFDLDSHATLTGYLTSSTPAAQTVTVTLSDGSTIGFSAIVTGLEIDEISFEDDDNVTGSFTLKVTGDVTFTPAA